MLEDVRPSDHESASGAMERDEERGLREQRAEAARGRGAAGRDEKWGLYDMQRVEQVT